MRRSRTSIRIAVLTAAAVALSPVAAAQADPAPAPTTAPAVNTLIPEDLLGTAIATLLGSNNDPVSLDAAQAVAQSIGRIFADPSNRLSFSTPAAGDATAPSATAKSPATPTPKAAPSAKTPAPAPAGPRNAAQNGTDYFAMLDAANKALKTLGINPFLNPSLSFNCAAPTQSNPMGITPGVAGTVTGPWSVPGVEIPRRNGFSTQVLDKGDVLYGFVPDKMSKPAPGSPKTGMKVAWFNVNTLKGGFVDMLKPGDAMVDLWLKDVPDGPLRQFSENLLGPIADNIAPEGTRLVPVRTNKGTVLSAVWGTAQNGKNTCFFLPMFGITNV